MKIRTADMLYQCLCDELAWRKKELTNIKLLHDKARDHQQELLRRAGVALLYAHWEGFVRGAGTAYIEFVARQGLQYQQLQPNFVAIAARQDLGMFAASQRGTILCRVSEFFRTKQGERATITWEKAIQTKANLSAELTRDIVVLLGLDYSPFQIHEKSVIERLRDWRNSIAHGKYLPVGAQDYSELHHKVLGLLDEFSTQITNAAFNREFAC
jgi:hypothetical protein